MTESAQAAPGRDRVVVIWTLATVVLLAWIFLWLEAVAMYAMGSGPGILASLGAVVMPIMPMGGPWTVGWLGLTFLMWTVMMAGMMLPSAAPAILLYGALAKGNAERGSVLPSVWIYTSGYLAVWTGFSLVVTLLQAWLQSSGLVNEMMVSSSLPLSAAILIAAGLYQWLPAKDACLEKCRDPLQTLLFRWHPGASGAFRMGFENGVFCTGCCWALMLLLFAAGVMNLLWVAALTVYVLVEKLMPGGRIAGRVAGLALVAFGGSMLLPF